MAVNKASPIPPWASVKIEPKRAFKFILTLGDIPAWVVQDADRPSPQLGLLITKAGEQLSQKKSLLMVTLVTSQSRC